MQAGGVVDHPFVPDLQVPGLGGFRVLGAALLGEGRDDIGGGVRAGQARDPLLILDQPRQPFQDGQVSVGPRGYPHDQLRGLAGIPLDASGDLQNRDAVVLDAVLVLDLAVGDGDARPQKGVRGLFPLRHARHVGRIDVPGVAQQFPDLTNGRCLVLGRAAGPDEGVRDERKLLV